MRDLLSCQEQVFTKFKRDSLKMRLQQRKIVQELRTLADGCECLIAEAEPKLLPSDFGRERDQLPAACARRSRQAISRVCSQAGLKANNECYFQRRSRLRTNSYSARSIN